jgi:hypothetical protein
MGRAVLAHFVPRRIPLRSATLSLVIALTITSACAANPVDWVVGDVLVAAGNGSYQVWHTANPTASKPSYTKLVLNPPLNDGLGGATAGCTFDSAYRLFTTNFDNSKVVRFSVDNGHGPISSVTAPGLTRSKSVAFDGQGNFFVGYAGTNGSGAGLAEYNHDGTLLNSFFSPTVSLENSGVDWIDVAVDGQTILYTSQGRKIFTFNTSLPNTPSSVYADLSTLSGAANKGKLFAIRILPVGDGPFSGGVLVADQSNVKLVKASGGVITSVQVFKFKNESNLQALSLDPTNPARFWVGDASTHDLIEFDMSTGSTVVTLNTGTGTSLGGVCVDGGFSAAQNLAPAKKVMPPQLTSTSNTFSFSTLTGGTFVATLVGLSNPVAVTVRDSLVHSSVGASDPTVFSFNPGSPPDTRFTGSIPCDTTFTSQAGMPNTCEVFEFETNPALDPSVISNIEVCSPLGCTPDENPLAYPNPRLLRNLDEDITDGINLYPLTGTKSNCVYTVNDQNFIKGAHSCGFQSPSQGQTFTKTLGSSIPFKFVAVGTNGSCSSPITGALGAGAIKPLLMITHLVPPGADGKPIAPISETVLVKGNSGGFPIFTFSGNTWQLQVDTSNLSVGHYLATVIDLQNQIPAFGVNFSLQ